MAHRPVFIAIHESPYVKILDTEFKFYSGFSISQMQKSIRSLHSSFLLTNPNYQDYVLEISTKSDKHLGAMLSAFNLKYKLADGQYRPLESVFQSSKIFSNGMQYKDIIEMTPQEAKHDPRLHTSGNVIGFELDGVSFPVYPNTFFYDWLYVSSLHNESNLSNEIMRFKAFTDIAFNPNKSINCQAKSAAVFVGLNESGLLEKALNSPDSFKTIVYGTDNEKKTTESQTEQLSFESLFR